MYAPIRVLEHETGPICSLCLVLFFGRFFFGWKKISQEFRLLLPRSRENAPFQNDSLFLQSWEGKRSTDMSTTALKPRLWRSRNSQWSINGTTVLVRGLHWSLHYPYDLYSTLIRDADKSTLKLQLTSPSPSLPLHHPSFSSFFPALAEGLKTLILGPTFSLPLFLGFPTLSMQDPIPKPKKVIEVKLGGFASPLPPPQTSVCRSMMSCPTRGMVVLVFSHSTECSSRGEAAKGSRSLRTHAGGDAGIPRTPSHGLSRGPCCLSCRRTKERSL